VLFAGDAHDATWEYVLKHYGPDVENCSVLIAPHHGRDSERSYDFIDHINVYVENDRFAAALGADTANANSQGYVFLVTIHETAEVQRAA
jgi:hypothetical protein